MGYMQCIPSLFKEPKLIVIYVLVLNLFFHHSKCQGTGTPPRFFSVVPTVTDTQLEGSNILIRCSADSIPDSRYSFIKDGGYIGTANTTSTSLRLTIDKNSTGVYQCEARNPLGAILSPRQPIQVAYIKPLSAADLTTVIKTIPEGSAVVLKLPTIDSVPAPKVIWKEGFQRINAGNSRQYVTLDNNLVLLAVDSADNGKTFRAEIRNEYNTESVDSPEFNIVVNNAGASTDPIPLTFVVQPKNSEAIENSLRFDFECVPNAGNGALGIQWYRKEGQLRTRISANEKYEISSTGRKLTILRVSASDAGEYECEALLNNAGNVNSITSAANLTVLSPPSFVSGLPYQTVAKDFSELIELPCEVRGSPTPQINWLFNAKPLPSTSRHTVGENGMLTISNVELDDAGMYQCFASNNVNQLSEVSISNWLIVNSSPPILVNGPQNVTIIQDKDVRLACQTQGAPKPTISWIRESGGTVENLTSDGRFQIFESGELLIARVLPEDTAKYTCTSTNSMGQVSAYAFLKVLVKTMITEPPVDRRVIKGSSAVFPCRVSRDDSVAVTWKWFHIDDRGETQLATTGDEHHISVVQGIDKGIYRCEVTSAGGNFTRQARLDVIELPFSPRITQVTLSEGERPRNVIVTWTPPFDGNDPIQNYKIQYRIVSGSDPLEPNSGWLNLPDVIPATTQSHSIVGLRPAQNYQFRVSAVNEVGEGQPSPAQPIPFIQIPQEPPSGPPIGLTGTPQSSSSIMLQWQEPDESVWNGLLRGYLIRYKPAQYPDSTMRYYNVTDNWQVTSHELRDLLVFQLYEISVAAYNDEGVGVYSASIQIRTKEGVPSVPPTDVNTQAINSTAIRVTWMPPDPQRINGINQGYKIRARRLSSTQPEEAFMSVSPDTSNPYGEQSAVMSNLRKYSTYQVTVVCYTSPGDGPVSAPSTVRTAEDLPGPVSSLSFDDVRDSSLIVHWSPPTEINGLLTGYDVIYKVKNSSGTGTTISKQDSDNHTEISGLSPVTLYTISVRAKTTVGPGPVLSADIKSGVPPEMPTAPQDLGLSDIQARSVKVQFSPGYDGKTSITKWIAEALVIDELKWTEVFNVSAPEATSITVRNLRPYTHYRLRLKAENIVGVSGPSEPSRQFQTIQAAPDTPPGNLTVRAINATAVRISWTPLATTDWNGVPKGYKIFYKPHDRDTFEEERIVLENINLDSYILTGLEEWTEYQVKMVAYNDVDGSVYSPISVERTREAVPSAGPANVTALPVTSTSINVTWSDVPLYDRNGMIQGYKIKYGSLDKGISSMMETISDNQTQSYAIEGLRKFVRYEVQVLAFTRMGDGVLSQPVVSVTTLQDLPDPPIIIYFPEVTYSLAQIVWEPPTEPNGVITGYRVTYRERNQTESQSIVNDTLSAEAREYTVRGLRRMTYYEFSVSAKTQLGWGPNSSVLVLTMINRQPPQSPTKPIIGSSQVSAREVTISWTPQEDGYGPLRNYTVQYKSQDGQWTTVDDVIHPDLTLYTVQSLQPNTWYQFRVAATNDIGTSDFSPPSDEVQTLQDKPDAPPKNVEVRPLTVSSIVVSWQEPDPKSWNGQPKGYVVQYRKADLPSYQEKLLNFTEQRTVLELFVQFVNYEVRVLMYNEKGRGPPSTPATIYVGEAPPNASPRKVKVMPVSSTELKVMWEPPPPGNQNGVLSGYKVSLWRVPADPGYVMPNQIVVGTEVRLTDLDIFTEYAVVVLAYNLAGDGPNSSVVTNRTLEDLPSEPRDLTFQNITLDSVNVTWKPPEFPNAFQVTYEVMYYQQDPSQGTSKSVLVTEILVPYHYATNLQNATFLFVVTARNKQGAGNSTNGTVTVGPQRFSPNRPTELDLVGEVGGVKLTWENGFSEKEPISGFHIQAMEVEEGVWTTVVKKNGDIAEALVSFNLLKLSTRYRFRVMAVNSYGISYPSEPSAVFMTQGGNGASAAGVTKEKAFYSQWWFLVIAALSGVIIILAVVSLLCLISKKSRKTDKRKVVNNVIVEPQEPEEGGFSSIELSQNRRSVHVRNGTLGRGNTLPRSAPQPNPGSVTYSDDDFKPQLPDDNSSSLDEKPSDLDDSTEPSDEESEPEGQQTFRGGASNFYSPYENTPAPRPSRYNQNATNAYSYTDSEQESSHYALGLNSGQLIVNNRAGSRAPLPGFSSFV